MGANEKYEAAMHGAEYTPRLRHVRAGYVRTTSGAVGLAEAEAQFARWLETVKAEAKAEALEEHASAILHIDEVILRGEISDDRWQDFAEAERDFTRNDSDIARSYYSANEHYAKYRAKQIREQS